MSNDYQSTWHIVGMWYVFVDRLNEWLGMYDLDTQEVKAYAGPK